MISHSKSCLKSSTMLLLYRTYVCFCVIILIVISDIIISAYDNYIFQNNDYLNNPND